MAAAMMYCVHVFVRLLTVIILTVDVQTEHDNDKCGAEICQPEHKNIYTSDSQDIAVLYRRKEVAKDIKSDAQNKGFSIENNELYSSDDIIAKKRGSVAALDVESHSNKQTEIVEDSDSGSVKYNKANAEPNDTDGQHLVPTQKVASKIKGPTYKFPPLTRLEPRVVGDRVELELQPGNMYTRITRSLRPPVFEISDFLSEEECAMIIARAVEKGMNTSQVFNFKIEEQLQADLNSSDIKRISKTTWLKRQDIGTEFLTSLHLRLSELTQVPVGVILRSEPLQVVSYDTAGHYHAHLDSKGRRDTPCCFQKRCDKRQTNTNCCKLCRFLTVLYFLNDVEAGGETAFPLADMPDDVYKGKLRNVSNQSWFNLSKYCHNSSLVIAPKKGTAVMWYNHFVDKQGYLGRFDQRAHHGGCDVIRGSKWIATNWIASTFYEKRFEPSIHFKP